MPWAIYLKSEKEFGKATLSPNMFNSGLEQVFRRLKWQDKLRNLRFADVVGFLNRSLNELQEMINELQEVSEKVGLKANMEKTKIIINSYTNCRSWMRLFTLVNKLQWKFLAVGKYIEVFQLDGLHLLGIWISSKVTYENVCSANCTSMYRTCYKIWISSIGFK